MDDRWQGTCNPMEAMLAHNRCPVIIGWMSKEGFVEDLSASWKSQTRSCRILMLGGPTGQEISEGCRKQWHLDKCSVIGSPVKKAKAKCTSGIVRFVCAQSCKTLVTLHGPVAHQALLSVEFSRQENCRVSFSLQITLLTQGLKQHLPWSWIEAGDPALAGRVFTTWASSHGVNIPSWSVSWCAWTQKWEEMHKLTVTHPWRREYEWGNMNSSQSSHCSLPAQLCVPGIRPLSLSLQWLWNLGFLSCSYRWGASQAQRC